MCVCVRRLCTHLAGQRLVCSPLAYVALFAWLVIFVLAVSRAVLWTPLAAKEVSQRTKYRALPRYLPAVWGVDQWNTKVAQSICCRHFPKILTVIAQQQINGAYEHSLWISAFTPHVWWAL